MANDFNFQIKGLDKFIISLNEMDDNFNRDLQALVEKHGGKLLRNTKKKTPVDTGQLRRSWQLEKGDLYVKLMNRTSYAIYIEYGHRTRGGGKPFEGVYMLKIPFERQKKEIQDELEQLLKRYGFK